MAHSSLLDQSLPAFSLGDSTNAHISFKQPSAADQPKSPLKRSPSNFDLDDPKDASEDMDSSVNPLRELSRLIPDKSMVTQHPSSRADQTCNMSLWQPAGLENISNIMNESLPASSRTFLDTTNVPGFDRSVHLPGAAQQHAGDVTSFHKLDTKSLDGTMLLDESLPHQLPDVSSLSFFQPPQSQTGRNVRKSPSKLVRTQPIIQEEDSDRSNGEIEVQDFGLLQSPRSTARTSKSSARPTPQQRDENFTFSPRHASRESGTLSNSPRLSATNKTVNLPSQQPFAASPLRQANVASQVYMPPKFEEQQQNASPSKLTSRMQSSAQSKRLVGHKRQSSICVKPREAAMTKNSYSQAQSSAEERVRGILSRQTTSEARRRLSAAPVTGTPTSTASALRTPSKSATTSLRQQERSAVRSRTYEDFKELLSPKSQPRTPATGITRSRTATSLSSQATPRPAASFGITRSRTATNLSSEAHTNSALPKSRTSTNLTTAATSSAYTPKTPAAGSSSSRPSGSGIIRSKSTPTITGMTGSSATARKRVSLLPPPPSARRQSTAASSAPQPASARPARRMSTALNQTAAPLGSRYGQPASAATRTASTRTVRLAEPPRSTAVARQRL